MKKIYFFPIAIILALAIFAFMPSKETLVGTWKINYPNGNQVTIIFRDNGTIRAEIPAEHFTVEGKYKVKGDMVFVMDSTCGTGYWSKYKSKFLSNDSVYSEVVEDSCTGRRKTVDKQTMVRVRN